MSAREAVGAGARADHRRARAAPRRSRGGAADHAPEPSSGTSRDAGACDWVCEAVIEDLATKRALLQRVEAVRRDRTVVSTNTSGIPLRAIAAGLPARLRRDLAVTHFFNPVKVMRLVELVPGADTSPAVLATFESFLGTRLGKGVVHAKDTVNFIANRIGCFWMLAGLHHGAAARTAGLATEDLDALMAAPVGIPATGLYGLIDLVGLDVLDLVARNLALNLPPDDMAAPTPALPAAEQAMLERGQIGRKAGAGFYRCAPRPRRPPRQGGVRPRHRGMARRAAGRARA